MAAVPLGDSARAHAPELAIWTELGQWHKSARSYASAVEVRGLACRAAQEPPWPPQEGSLDVMVVICRCAGSLVQYVSRVRSVLALIRGDAGALAITGGLARGALKRAAHDGGRYKSRATAVQARLPRSLFPFPSVPVVRRSGTWPSGPAARPGAGTLQAGLTPNPPRLRRRGEGLSSGGYGVGEGAPRARCLRRRPPVMLAVRLGVGGPQCHGPLVRLGARAPGSGGSAGPRRSRGQRGRYVRRRAPARRVSSW